MGLTSLRKQIEKLPSITQNPPPDFNEWIEKKKVLGLLDGYIIVKKPNINENGILVLPEEQLREIGKAVLSKTNVCIPRKQLQELYDRYHGEDDSKRELIKELLEK